VHPDRKSGVWTVAFSPDGTRLFTAGYPSGVVQIWDVASRKEAVRINTPPGLRGTAEYALLAPDWKTLYVPVEKRSVKPFERDGKKQARLEESGQVRIWDVSAGKERESLRPPEGTAPVYAKLSPDGRLLYCVERTGYESPGGRPQDTSVIWNLVDGTKRKLADGFSHPVFAPDGRTAVVSQNDRQAKTFALKVLELSTGKELATLQCPEKERYFSVSSISPDGAVVATSLGGQKGAPMEVWFRDAHKLADRGKLVGKGDPERDGWGSGAFSPDSKHYIMVDSEGNVLVWNVGAQKLERTLSVGVRAPTWRIAISPEGQTLAVAWLPPLDPELERTLAPDPLDLPQPRVILVDLRAKSRPRVLIAPHGHVGSLAFSPDGNLLALGSAGAVHLFDLGK
jgi:WD40 repeat protein